MILSLTMNPSIDKTIELPSALDVGSVQRASRATSQAGGKGINVSVALNHAGEETLAIFPSPSSSPLLEALKAQRLPFLALPIDGEVRTNTSVVSPDGTTTKINEPGPLLSAEDLENIVSTTISRALGCSWVVLAGSLPPRVREDFYPFLIKRMRTALGNECPRIALDTSGKPLLQTFSPQQEERALPDLIKPNGEELTSLSGGEHAQEIENNPLLAAQLAAPLLEKGVHVLTTLGGNGAVLSTPSGAFHAIHNPIKVRSTVGAGDSSLAGFILAHSRGQGPEESLKQAVAYGSAAASLPGTTLPTPQDVTAQAVTSQPLSSLTTKALPHHLPPEIDPHQ